MRELLSRLFRRGDPQPERASLVGVVSAVAFGTEQDVAQAAASWARRQRDEAERSEDAERYKAAADWLRKRVKNSPGHCYMPGIDD